MGVGGELRLRRVDSTCSTSVMRASWIRNRIATKVCVSFCSTVCKCPPGRWSDRTYQRLAHLTGDGIPAAVRKRHLDIVLDKAHALRERRKLRIVLAVSSAIAFGNTLQAGLVAALGSRRGCSQANRRQHAQDDQPAVAHCC